MVHTCQGLETKRRTFNSLLSHQLHPAHSYPLGMHVTCKAARNIEEGLSPLSPASPTQICKVLTLLASSCFREAALAHVPGATFRFIANLFRKKRLWQVVLCYLQPCRCTLSLQPGRGLGTVVKVTNSRACERERERERESQSHDKATWRFIGSYKWGCK